jgi:hypothetical protein
MYGARTISKNRMEGSVTCLYGFLDAMDDFKRGDGKFPENALREQMVRSGC